MVQFVSWSRTWRIPLAAQNMQKSVREEEHPKAMFMRPVRNSPPPSMMRGESTSDSVPDTNLDMP